MLQRQWDVGRLGNGFGRRDRAGAAVAAAAEKPVPATVVTDEPVETVEALRMRLLKAVAAEDFEGAAKLRDQIEKLAPKKKPKAKFSKNLQIRREYACA